MHCTGHSHHVDGTVDGTRDAQRDPVCGMNVSEHGTLRTVHQGTTYVFCSEHCLQRFRDDPARYVTDAPMSDVVGHASASGSGTAYVCPMDPDVLQESPGACPKCGMMLEPEVAAPAPTRTEYVCPMHPEIVRSEPGSCPICGMALEPKGVPTGDEGPNPELIDFKRRFWIGAALAIPLLILSMGPLVGLGFLRDMLGERPALWVEIGRAHV